MNTTQFWMEGVGDVIASYRRMIDAAVEQLTDEELHRRISPDTNSVAIILRHLGGNLKSRWSDFFASDGEKPNRDRDGEFCDWRGDRQSLLMHFDTGWQCLTTAIECINDTNIKQSILIRGESHTVPQAMLRTLGHIAYHSGQITMIARRVHRGSWNWLTIAPGASHDHNQQTWGTTGSRGVMGKSSDEDD